MFIIPRLAIASFVASVSFSAQAHFVFLRTEVARGACAVVENTESQCNPFSGLNGLYGCFQHNQSKISYRDGKVELFAVVSPSKPLPEGKPDDLMTRCTQAVAPEVLNVQSDNGNVGGVLKEDIFLQRINKCLSEGGAQYEAIYMTFRRSAVKCP